jgi:hypothetical protein
MCTLCIENATFLAHKKDNLQQLLIINSLLEVVIGDL